MRDNCGQVFAAHWQCLDRRNQVRFVSSTSLPRFVSLLLVSLELVQSLILGLGARCDGLGADVREMSKRREEDERLCGGEAGELNSVVLLFRCFLEDGAGGIALGSSSETKGGLRGVEEEVLGGLSHPIFVKTRRTHSCRIRSADASPPSLPSHSLLSLPHRLLSLTHPPSFPLLFFLPQPSKLIPPPPPFLFVRSPGPQESPPWRSGRAGSSQGR